MIDRTVTFAKHHTPNSVRVAARRMLLEAHNAKLRITVPVSTPSAYENVFHCAMRKTASQWIKAMFADPIVYRHSGLLSYDPRPCKWRHPEPFPSGRVVSSLFLSHKKFQAIPRPERCRTFFVMRDPRDIVVSSYFSTRSSHTPMGDIPRVRKVLQEKPRKEGMLYVIGQLSAKGSFNALRSWATSGGSDEICLFRYEDLTGPDQRDEVDRLLRHCGIVLPPAELDGLLRRYRFSNMRGSHYRKGEAGDWETTSTRPLRRRPATLSSNSAIPRRAGSPAGATSEARQRAARRRWRCAAMRTGALGSPKRSYPCRRSTSSKKTRPPKTGV
jgi:Sulfotransferase domain